MFIQYMGGEIFLKITVRARLLFGIALLAMLLHGGGADAFHDGGVGICEGCHTMHGNGGSSGPWLLKGTDPSSICLNCHAGLGGPDSYTVFSPDGSALTPGGDFYWLTKDFVWADGASLGNTHGHNILAQDFGLFQDMVNNQAPGGTYQSVHLGCTSCHDPHGKVQGGTMNNSMPVSVSGSYGEAPEAGAVRGNYRLLGDAVYDGGKPAQGYVFTYNAPIARQNSINKFGEFDSSHVAYGSGMSEWCGNCHGNYLINEHSTFEHPSGNTEKLSSVMVDNYNTYVRTGDFSGITATAYLQFVPFERGISDPELLDPTSTQGPDANSNVMCLTCHRAHASAFRNAARWDPDAVLLVDSHPAAGDGGVTGSDVYYSYYGRDIASEFGTTQRAFCEKCHDVNGP